MDVLEKARLVDELKHLIVGLNDNKASLFEIAKSKQRIKDICASCNDPLFQDELTAFKEFMQHWQIWVIRPSLSFLKSPWMNSTKEALNWLNKYGREFLRTDEELKTMIPVLEPISPEVGMHLSPSAQEQLSILRKETANFDSQLEAIIQEKIQPVIVSQETNSVVTRSRPSFRQNTSLNLNKAKPVTLKDFNLDGLVCRFERVDPKSYPSLYRVELHDEINQNIKIDWLYLKAENDEQPIWETAQIFIAEQHYVQGQFSHYVVLIGTHSVDYAISVLQTYTDQRHTKTSSIHQTNWTTFKKYYHHHETLFNECIMNGNQVWQRNEQTYPYIPASFINTKKFISFEETTANFLTPVILLKEHQKIRVIHGSERIKLSTEDQAYPYLLLDRTDGYTWQLIRQVISRLTQPISVNDLYQALESADVSVS